MAERFLQTGLRALKEAIHEVVLVRFSQVPPELEQRLESCHDPDRLQVWPRMALTAPDPTTLLNQVR